MKLSEYIKKRNTNREAEIKSMESKIAESNDKAEALDIILGEDGGDSDGGDDANRAEFADDRRN